MGDEECWGMRAQGWDGRGGYGCQDKRPMSHGSFSLEDGEGGFLYRPEPHLLSPPPGTPANPTPSHLTPAVPTPCCTHSVIPTPRCIISVIPTPATITPCHPAIPIPTQPISTLAIPTRKPHPCTAFDITRD